MSDRANVIYRYDGTLEGLMCCVFESYTRKEIPLDIISGEELEINLLPIKTITTSLPDAYRVIKAIKTKIGPSAFDLIERSLLTELKKKEITILLFIRLGFCHGDKTLNMLDHEIVNTLLKADRHLRNESHLLTGFIRFSIINNILVSQIEPKNFVLPVIQDHFCQRFAEEKFFIYDKTHKSALLYEPYHSMIMTDVEYCEPDPDDQESTYRLLWKQFYDSIEIKSRHNPKCRMSHMPKRYWNCMTELKTEQPGNPKKLLSSY